MLYCEIYWLINSYLLKFGHSTTDVLTDAFRKWRSARAHFAASLESFIQATSTLELACSNSPFSDLHKQVARNIELERRPIDRYEQRLADARLSLRRLRNRCTGSISLLSPEILALIFRMAAEAHIPSQRCPDCVTVLASVCHSWRITVTSISKLWAHISFNNGAPHFNNVNEKSRLWLERSRDAPVHLEFDRLFKGPSLIPPKELKRFLDTLKPHMKRLGSLRLRTALENVVSILDFWLQFGSPGSLTMLSIRSLDSPDPVDCLDIIRQPTTNTLDDFLRPVQILELTDIYLDWGSAAFEGLTALSFDSLNPTVTQLAHILSSCPMLKKLVLNNIKIKGSAAIVGIPIKLFHLEKIFLVDLEPATLKKLFRIMLPHCDKLDLDIYDILSETTVTILRSLWSGIKVSVLRLNRAFKPLLLHKLLTSFRGTQTVVFYYSDISVPLLEALAGCHTRSDPNAIFPNLHTMEFRNCQIFCVSALQNMIHAHPVQRLRFTSCTFGPSHDSERTRSRSYSDSSASSDFTDLDFPEDFSDIYASLKNIVPDLKIYQHGMRFHLLLRRLTYHSCI